MGSPYDTPPGKAPPGYEYYPVDYFTSGGSSPQRIMRRKWKLRPTTGPVPPTAPPPYAPPPPPVLTGPRRLPIAPQPPPTPKPKPVPVQVTPSRARIVPQGPTLPWRPP